LFYNFDHMSTKKNERKCICKHLEILLQYTCKNLLFQTEIKRIVEKLRLNPEYKVSSNNELFIKIKTDIAINLIL